MDSYTTIPMTIEAVQWINVKFPELKEWCPSAKFTPDLERFCGWITGKGFKSYESDYILKFPDGTFRSMDISEFEKKYRKI